MKRNLLIICLMAFSSFAIAQTGTIKGRILDQDTNESLIGANAVISGTTQGATTDIDGYFTITNVPVGAVTLNITFIGYSPITKKVTVNSGQDAVTDLGDIILSSNTIGLNEIEVIASVAIDRKTPVAVSTIKGSYIEEKLGSQEFPEILKGTPGVYVTKAGGGFGDSRIRIRGFDSENVAVMINGVPVNDMENGRVYWSNWAGLSDVTGSMQVQRGLGASKIAVPSVGGTINIVSKATDAQKGGSVFIGTGNNLYNKVGISVSTGVNDKGWAMTLQGTRTQGDNFANGLEFLGWSYFMNVAKKINDQHLLTFTVIGAQQRHGQRQNYLPYTTYKNSPNGIRQNNDWGRLGGEVVNVEDNFYSKPQISLNHYWTINETTELATTAYVSFGTGGGGGTAGSNRDLFNVRTGGDGPTYGYQDLDNIVEVNQAAAAAGNESEAYLRASRNDHSWYGILSVLTKDIGSNFVLSAGLDARYYRGKHFREVTNLLGGDFVINTRDVNNPNQVIGVGDKFAYNNDGVVNWLGGFAQGEYTLDALTVFASASVSNSSYTRVDYFQYTPDNQVSETKNFLGYVFKSGANYNLNDHHNIFINAGYFERAPFFNGVFTSNTNEANPNATNEKVLGLEAGYGIKYSKGGVSINAYYTNWRDKTFTQRIQIPSGEDITVNVLGVNALHQGVEAEFYYNPTPKLKMRGSLSLGNWRWQNDLIDVPVFDENNDQIGTVDLYIKDVRVGDAAQTTAAIGLDYELFDSFSINGDFNYADNLFARFDPLQRGDAPAPGETNEQALQLPSYGLFDFGFRYGFKLGNLNSSLSGRINNAFDTIYVPDALDAADLTSARVFMGFGRTWTMSLRVKF